MALDQLFSIFLGSENWILPEFPELKTNKQTIKKKKESLQKQPTSQRNLHVQCFIFMDGKTTIDCFTQVLS